MRNALNLILAQHGHAVLRELGWRRDERNDAWVYEGPRVMGSEEMCRRLERAE